MQRSHAWPLKCNEPTSVGASNSAGERSHASQSTDSMRKAAATPAPIRRLVAGACRHRARRLCASAAARVTRQPSRPSCNRRVRSASAASRSLWVTMTRVMPRVAVELHEQLRAPRRRWPGRGCRSARRRGRRAATGRRRAPRRRAAARRPRARRACARAAARGRPASARRGARCAASSQPRPRIRPGIMVFSSAVKSGSRWWNWKMKPISRLRNAARSRSFIAVRRLPPNQHLRRRSAGRARRARAAACSCRRRTGRRSPPSRPAPTARSRSRSTSTRWRSPSP